MIDESLSTFIDGDCQHRPPATTDGQPAKPVRRFSKRLGLP